MCLFSFKIPTVTVVSFVVIKKMPEPISIIITFKAQMTLLISSWMLITVGNSHRNPVTSLFITDIYDLLVTSLASPSTHTHLTGTRQ